jgi:hypothetical protein
MLSHRPGQIIYDTEGRPIACHGGGLLQHEGRWYWYGEGSRPPGHSTTGVTGYVSDDLATWQNLGVVLTPAEGLSLLPAGVRDPVIERPKVLWHPRTRRFVMWMHLDGDAYTRSLCGVAVADRPEGPFRLLRCFRPLHYAGSIPANDDRREAELGRTFNDMNLFADADGSAWLFYSSERLMTLYVARLGEDWTDVERPAVEGLTWARALVGRMREAPAPFVHRGRYYLLSSGCVGWIPNPLAWASAPHPLGPWTHGGDPCSGPWADTGYDTQPTCVIPAPGGAPGTFLYLGDRWNAADLPDSRQIWLPFRIAEDGAVRLDWRSAWDAATLAPAQAPVSAPVVRASAVCRHGPPTHPDRVRLAWDAVPGADLYVVRRNGFELLRTDACAVELAPGLPGVPGSYTVEPLHLTGGTGPVSQPATFTLERPRACHLSDHAPVRRWTGFANALADRAWDGGPLRIGDQSYPKGLFTHSEAELLWDLGGCYASFTAEVGLMPSPSGGSAAFRVLIDGREVFASGLLSSGDAPVPVRVDCRGARILELRVEAGPGGIGNAHAVWGGALLTP